MQEIHSALCWRLSIPLLPLADLPYWHSVSWCCLSHSILLCKGLVGTVKPKGLRSHPLARALLKQKAAMPWKQRDVEEAARPLRISFSLSVWSLWEEREWHTPINLSPNKNIQVFLFAYINSWDWVWGHRCNTDRCFLHFHPCASQHLIHIHASRAWLSLGSPDIITGPFNHSPRPNMCWKSEMQFPNAPGLTVSLALGKAIYLSRQGCHCVSWAGIHLMFSLTSSPLVAWH